MLQLNLQKSVEKSHMSERQSVSAVPNAEPQLDWFWTFFSFFCKFLTRHIKKEWQNVKVFWPPQLKNLKFVMLWPQLQRSISNYGLPSITIFSGTSLAYYTGSVNYVTTTLRMMATWTLIWSFFVTHLLGWDGKKVDQISRNILYSTFKDLILAFVMKN